MSFVVQSLLPSKVPEGDPKQFYSVHNSVNLTVQNCREDEKG